MSTITSPPRPAVGPAPPIPPSQTPDATVLMGQQRIAIRNVSWDLYDLLSDAIGEGQHVYLAYDGKDLEIMTTGFRHDDMKEMLGWFVRILTSELRIRSRGAGQTTWKRPEIARGLEADLCYFFTAERLAASWQLDPASPTTSPTIPTPTWQSRSISHHRRFDRPGIYAGAERDRSLAIRGVISDHRAPSAGWDVFAIGIEPVPPGPGRGSLPVGGRRRLQRRIGLGAKTARMGPRRVGAAAQRLIDLAPPCRKPNL